MVTKVHAAIVVAVMAGCSPAAAEVPPPGSAFFAAVPASLAILLMALAILVLATRRVVRPPEQLRGADVAERLEESHRRLAEHASQLAAANEELRRENRERLVADEALRLSEQRYALAAEGAGAGVWDWDLLQGTLFLSPRWKAMIGFGSEELGGGPNEWFDRVHPEDAGAMHADLDRHLSGAEAHFESLYRLACKGGSYRWMHCRGLAVRDGNDVPIRMVGSQTDVTERKAFEDRLQHQALHDTLTGLPNRALFVDRLSRAIQHARRRPDEPFAVVFIDLDRFKLVNDTHGHRVGDALLRLVAARIRASVREVDTVARLGGDEFALLLESVRGSSEAEAMVERIRLEVARPYEIEGHEIFTEASCGLVMGPSDEQEPGDYLRRADTAMYRAKAEPGTVAVFDELMDSSSAERLALERDLRHAVEEGYLELAYQPIVEVATGRMAGAEALLRWRHPIRGLVMPDSFVPVAEETALIHAVGRWVIRDACQQLHRWRNQGVGADFWISINLSWRQFQDRGLVPMIADTLARHAVPASLVRFEITETAVMEQLSTAIERLSELRAIGVQVFLDDFGTGYSSLAHLNQLPIDVVKIDRQFVVDLGPDGTRPSIANVIVDLAHSLGLQAIAEGIENDRQLREIERLGCDFAQGFRLARPMTAAQIGASFAEPLRAAGTAC